MKALSCVFKLFFVNLEATQLIETAIEMQQELRALQGGLDFIVAYRDILWDMKMFAVF